MAAQTLQLHRLTNLIPTPLVYTYRNFSFISDRKKKSKSLFCSMTIKTDTIYGRLFMTRYGFLMNRLSPHGGTASVLVRSEKKASRKSLNHPGSRENSNTAICQNRFFREQKN